MSYVTAKCQCYQQQQDLFKYLKVHFFHSKTDEAVCFYCMGLLRNGQKHQRVCDLESVEAAAVIEWYEGSIHFLFNFVTYIIFFLQRCRKIILDPTRFSFELFNPICSYRNGGWKGFQYMFKQIYRMAIDFFRPQLHTT